MRIHILQHEDRLDDRWIMKCMDQVHSYSIRYKYVYNRNNKSYENICPYYAKIFYVKEYMEDNIDTCDYVLFLDSDCLIADEERRIENIIRQYNLHTNKHFICTGDKVHINLGHFIVRNSRQGRSIMTSWVNLYDSARWKQSSITGKYVCTTPFNRTCNWSGRYYEQGDFIEFIYPKFSGIISTDSKQYPDLFLNCDTIVNYKNSLIRYKNENKKPFVIHLCGHLKIRSIGVVFDMIGISSKIHFLN